MLTRAAHAARRFQFVANCYRARAASPASLRHEAQQVLDLLWDMGLRPQTRDGDKADSQTPASPPALQ